MRKLTKCNVLAWSLLLLAILAVNLLAPSEAAAKDWKYKWGHFSGEAGEGLDTGDAVCIWTDGKVYKADADNSTARPAIGLIGKGGVAGDQVEIVTSGILGGVGTGTTAIDEATQGSRIYLQATPGAVNSTAPISGNQTIGVVLPGGDDWYVNPMLPMSGSGY